MAKQRYEDGPPPALGAGTTEAVDEALDNVGADTAPEGEKTGASNTPLPTPGGEGDTSAGGASQTANVADAPSGSGPAAPPAQGNDAKTLAKLLEHVVEHRDGIDELVKAVPRLKLKVHARDVTISRLRQAQSWLAQTAEYLEALG